MLIGFRVGNFRSFLSEQTLSFRASSDDSHELTHCVATNLSSIPRLTRTVALFGPNGSGKSNLLAALRTMRELVLQSTSFSPEQFATRYTPFYSLDSRGSPSTFMIDLLLSGTRYRYGFAFDATRIVSEQLWTYESHKPQRWFGRRFDAETATESWNPFSAKFSGPREMWRKATRPQSLFLSTAGQLESEQLAPLMHWFEHQLDVTLSSDVMDSRLLAGRLRDADFKASALAILRAVDIPVSDIRVTPPPVASVVALSHGTVGPLLPTIEFLRTRYDLPPYWVDSRHDASGAQRLVSMLVPLLDGVEKDRFVAIDEFDAHLHPVVARFLIQVINDPTAIHRRVQVLLVTHNTTLMDLEMLRRDELWLMENDDRHASRLTALIEQSPRRHELVAKTYIRGRYGGIPKIDFEQYHGTLGSRRPDPPEVRKKSR